MSAATVLALAARLAAEAEEQGVPPFHISATGGDFPAITFMTHDDDLTPALAVALGLTTRTTYELKDEPGMSREVFKAVIEDVEVGTHHAVPTESLVVAA